jgi:hypothetical protein
MFKKLHRPLPLVALMLMAAYITSSVVIAARSRPSPFPLTHSTNHLEVQLLLVQYALLLPALACYMLDKRMPDGNALPRTTLPVGTSYLMYAVLAVYVARMTRGSHRSKISLAVKRTHGFKLVFNTLRTQILAFTCEDG